MRKSILVLAVCFISFSFANKQFTHEGLDEIYDQLKSLNKCGNILSKDVEKAQNLLTIIATGTGELVLENGSKLNFELGGAYATKYEYEEFAKLLNTLGPKLYQPAIECLEKFSYLKNRTNIEFVESEIRKGQYEYFNNFNILNTKEGVSELIKFGKSIITNPVLLKALNCFKKGIDSGSYLKSSHKHKIDPFILLLIGADCAHLSQTFNQKYSKNEEFFAKCLLNAIKKSDLFEFKHPIEFLLGFVFSEHNNIDDVLCSKQISLESYSPANNPFAKFSLDNNNSFKLTFSPFFKERLKEYTNNDNYESIWCNETDEHKIMEEFKKSLNFRVSPSSIEPRESWKIEGGYVFERDIRSLIKLHKSKIDKSFVRKLAFSDQDNLTKSYIVCLRCGLFTLEEKDQIWKEIKKNLESMGWLAKKAILKYFFRQNDELDRVLVSDKDLIEIYEDPKNIGDVSNDIENIIKENRKYLSYKLRGALDNLHRPTNNLGETIMAVDNTKYFETMSKVYEKVTISEENVFKFTGYKKISKKFTKEFVSKIKDVKFAKEKLIEEFKRHNKHDKNSPAYAKMLSQFDREDGGFQKVLPTIVTEIELNGGNYEEFLYNFEQVITSNNENHGSEFAQSCSPSRFAVVGLDGYESITKHYSDPAYLSLAIKPLEKEMRRDSSMIYLNPSLLSEFVAKSKTEDELYNQIIYKYSAKYDEYNEEYKKRIRGIASWFMKLKEMDILKDLYAGLEEEQVFLNTIQPKMSVVTYAFSEKSDLTNASSDILNEMMNFLQKQINDGKIMLSLISENDLKEVLEKRFIDMFEKFNLSGSTNLGQIMKTTVKNPNGGFLRTSLESKITDKVFDLYKANKSKCGK